MTITISNGRGSSVTYDSWTAFVCSEGEDATPSRLREIIDACRVAAGRRPTNDDRWQFVEEHLENALRSLPEGRVVGGEPLRGEQDDSDGRGRATDSPDRQAHRRGHATT